MKKRTVKIVGLLVVLVLGVGGFLWWRSQRKDTDVVVPVSPEIESGYEGEIDFVLELKESDFEAPESLPVLSVARRSISRLQANAIARKGGFLDSPTTDTDAVEGIKYFWSKENDYLIVTPKTNIVKYGLFDTSTTDRELLLSDSELVSVAQEHLDTYFGLTSDTVEATTIDYLVETSSQGVQKISDREKAEIFQINFRPVSTEYPVLSSESTKGVYFVRTMSDGTVTESELIFGETTELSEEKYPVLDYDGLLENLTSSKLIDLTGQYIALRDIPNQVSKANISSAEIAYYKEPGDSIYQPVFILQGTVTLKYNAQSLPAKFYLPAFK